MSKYKGYTESAKAASQRYQKSGQDRFLIQFPKSSGEMEKIDAHCALTGEPRLTFVKRAIRETIQRDREKFRENIKNQPKIKIDDE